MHYAPRVRSLNLSVFTTVDLALPPSLYSPSIFAVLEKFQLPMLPRCSYIRYKGTFSVEAATALLHDMVQDLHLGVIDAPIVKVMASQCRSLENFSATGVFPPDESLVHYLRAVTSFRTVCLTRTNLTAGGPSLMALARNRYLQALTISMKSVSEHWDRWITPPSPWFRGDLVGDTFPALTELTINTNLDIFMKCFGVVTVFPCLTKLNIRLEVRPTNDQLSKFCDMLATLYTSLTTLWIFLPGWYGPSSSTTDFRSFRALFALRGIVSFTLHDYLLLDITETHIRELAMAWPNIHTLSLAPEPHCNLAEGLDDPPLTLSALFSLSELANRLETVSLCLDTTVEVAHKPEQVFRFGEQFRKLNIGFSPIDNLEYVLQCLGQIMHLDAKLEILDAFTMILNREECAEYKESWGEVVQRLRDSVTQSLSDGR